MTLFAKEVLGSNSGMGIYLCADHKYFLSNNSGVLCLISNVEIGNVQQILANKNNWPLFW